MTPWDIKRQIETAHQLAERFGFVLDENINSYAYQPGKIHLTAAPNNEVFAKNIVLNQFDTWNDLMMFFQGYEKADMAWNLGKGKKK